MRIIVTLSLLAGLRLLDGRIPGIEEPGIRFFALGIGPFAAAFIYVELASFIFPPVRRLRHGGIAGRAKLNYAAKCLGLGFAALWALGILIAFQRSGLVQNPGLLFLVMSGAALAVGAAITFAVAGAITRWGVGNGFCCMILLESLWPVFTQTRDSGLLGNPLELLAWTAGIAAVAWMFARRPRTEFSDSQLGTIPVTLPRFPQGIEPIAAWAPLLSTLSLLGDPQSTEQPFQSPFGLFIIAVLITSVSAGTFHLFSSRKRLEQNLPAGVQPAEDQTLSRQWLLSTALLVVFGVGFEAGGEWFLNFRFTVIGFAALVTLVAIGVDVVAEWQFRHKNGDGVVRLIELDNVYSACYLHGLLTSQGVDSLVRTFHYRSLFYFFSPIVKMELLVAAADAEQAREIIRPERIKIV